jgi:hypothetical protein
METNKKRSFGRIFLFYCIILIFSFLLLELVAFSYYKISRFLYEMQQPEVQDSEENRKNQQKIKEELYRLETFDSEAYFNELKELIYNNIEYHPGRWYYYKPYYPGKLVFTDRLGYRNRPEIWHQESRPVIAFFGGSTLFGVNNPYAYTIPSVFAGLYPSSMPVRVFNFGMPGYSSAAEINATLEVFRYLHPDTCIYYDGVNEVIMRYVRHTYKTNDSLYSKIGFANIEQLYFAINNSQYHIKNPVQKFTFSPDILNSYTLLRGIANRIKPQSTEGAGPEIQEDQNVMLDRIGNEIRDIYFENIRVTRAICREYGSVPVFVLQPTLFHKNCAFTEYEKGLISKEPMLEFFFKEAYQKILNDPRCEEFGIINLSGIVTESVSEGKENFYDYCHVNGVINTAVAHALRAQLNNWHERKNTQTTKEH